MTYNVNVEGYYVTVRLQEAKTTSTSGGNVTIEDPSVRIEHVAAIVTELELATLRRVSTRVNRELRKRATVTPRKVHQLLVERRLATDAGKHAPGIERRYTAVDVALVRLWTRLRLQEVSASAARVLIGVFRDRLVEVWRDGLPMAFSVVPPGAAVTAVSAGEPSNAIAWVPLQEVWSGIERAMRRAGAKS